MTEKEKTDLEKQHEERMKKENKSWKCLVVNTILGNKIETEYTSENCDLDGILHKVKLDLMTNLHFNYSEPIKIRIIEVEV